MNDDANVARKRLSRADAKARTRELLLDAAEQVFARKGFAGASVEEIAETAGYSIGAVYSNFGSKDKLFTELLSSRAGGRVQQAARLLADGDDANPLAALGQLLVAVADKDRDWAPLQAEFWLYAIRNPDAMDALAAQLRRPLDGLTALLNGELAARGLQDRVPVDMLATIVFALFRGLVQQRRLDPASVSDETFAQALRWLLAGIDTAPD
ncbi:TetR/AcrR family transcriptional regulator [Nocardia otitidiscaviarum]|uniref:TetR/AcrR family transcriptional regulator n=1 Tax=Nocardia otitidiscaviarum TaxID=1823 RepID=UPI002454FE68|nr:TetR family transcriptional regulator [Nocardia otitidiscaviarum]